MTEPDNFFAEGQFGDQKQIALQGVAYWLFASHFGFRTEINPDVSWEKQSWKRQLILLWKAQRGPKACSRPGQVFECFIHFSNNISRTLSGFKDYKTEISEPESSFYFAIKHQQNPNDNIWHKKSSLGADEVVKLLLKTAQNNSWKKTLTNYSLRKTCIQGFSIQTYL